MTLSEKTTFVVATAQTVYWEYEVEADTEEEAKQLVSNSDTRAAIERHWQSSVQGDDEEVMDVRSA